MSSRIEKLRNIAAMNNEGTDLLPRGRAREAMGRFQDALRCILSMFDQEKEGEAFHTIGSSMFEDRVNTVIPRVYDLDSVECDPCFYSYDIKDYFGHESFFVHAKTLVIIADRHNIESSTRFLMELSCYYAIISFNVAVIYHIQGKQRNNKPTLLKAAKIYRMVARIIDPYFMLSEYMRMLHIMTLNNEAHIQFRLHNDGECKIILDYLARKLKFREPFTDDVRDLPKTRMNIELFNAPTSAPSA